jgi:peptidoglycan/xylan/chitin deacetylase (PgdA/CDA1 family)
MPQTSLPGLFAHVARDRKRIRVRRVSKGSVRAAGYRRLHLEILETRKLLSGFGATLGGDAANMGVISSGSEASPSIYQPYSDPPYVMPAVTFPTLIDENLSATQARDGQTITVGYQINSGEAASISLECTIVGSDGIAVRDAANTVSINVTPGIHWYTRSFTLNLPPAAVLGAYSVTWTIRKDANSHCSATRTDYLTVQPPIEVRVPTIMYHNVAEIEYDYYTVTTADFTAQMRALKAYGYTAVTMQDVLDYRAGVKTLPAKPILITFDDGYESMYTIVAPILADPTIDYRATVFVASSAVRPENVPGGYPTDFLSGLQIRALAASGRVEIGSHTVDHPDLTALDPAELTAELVDSKNALQQFLLGLEVGKEQVNSIAYPYGASNAAVEMAVWQAGYFAGLRVDDMVEMTADAKFALTRVQVDMDTSVELDQSSWYEFFLRKIEDPDLDIPDLSVTGIQYLDPITLNPLDIMQIHRGQAVRVKVTVNNEAAPAGVVATLKLDSDSNHNNGTIYDSHAMTPSQDVQLICPWGNSSFQWTWTVPGDAPLGQYYWKVSFNDPHYVLVFKNSNWQTAFQVIPGSSMMIMPMTAEAPPTAMTISPTYASEANSFDNVSVKQAFPQRDAAIPLTAAKSVRHPFVRRVTETNPFLRSRTLSADRANLHDAVMTMEIRWPLLRKIDALLNPKILDIT